MCTTCGEYINGCGAMWLLRSCASSGFVCESVCESVCVFHEWVVAAVGVRSYTAGVSGSVVFCIYALQRLEATVSSNHRFSAQLTLVCVVDQCVCVYM